MFLVFGTTAPFRKVYMESMRECCACGSRNKRSAGTSGGLEDGRGWSTLASPADRVPTYHARVEAAGNFSGNARPADKGKGNGLVQEFELQRSPAKLEQPWRTLGITPVER